MTKIRYRCNKAVASVTKHCQGTYQIFRKLQTLELNKGKTNCCYIIQIWASEKYQRRLVNIDGNLAVHSVCLSKYA